MKPALEQAAREAWAERLDLLAATLSDGRAISARGPEVSAQNVGRLVHDLLDKGDAGQIWLALSVMTGRLPDETHVQAVAMASEFDTGEALGEAITAAADRSSLRRPVTVAGPGTVLIDVATTLSVPFMTGIQRVVRETAERWVAAHPNACPVVWTRDESAPRELTELERTRFAERTGGQTPHRSDRTERVVVPWQGVYLLPDVSTNLARSAALQAMARFARVRTGAVGHDVVVVTSGETRTDHLTETFYSYLSALQAFDVVATTSIASAAEFAGWSRALRSIGRDGPRQVTVRLPVAIDRADDRARAEVRAVWGSRLPVVLVVGSHEPRKNHLAILHAAELLWREGLQFRLCFIGGRAWGSEEFGRRTTDLLSARRPLDVLSGVDDDFMAAAYECARFTVFPSFNEGFGLPVGESLALGTPVITANHGSMAEIAAEGGAVTVDPRDDHAIADAMRRLLTDDAWLAELETGARNRPSRSWDDYATETWAALVLDEG